jgi:hypothetical protein
MLRDEASFVLLWEWSEMERNHRALPKLARVGVAPLGSSEARIGLVYRVDERLGTTVLTEVRNLHGDEKADATTSQLRIDVATTAAEVLMSHLSNYLGSEDQKGKIPPSESDFAAFIRQSIVGTDPIVTDIALHAQVPERKGYFHIAQVEGKGKDDPSFGAIGLRDSIPRISSNLELVIFYPGGAHIAHRGGSRQYFLHKDGFEQLTEDYHVGGLLSALDKKGDFLPKVELKQISMSPGDRIIIFSQGAVPVGHKIEFVDLHRGRSETPQSQAEYIARQIARYNVEGGHVIVIGGIEEKSVPNVRPVSAEPRVNPPSRLSHKPPLREERTSNASHKPSPPFDAKPVTRTLIGMVAPDPSKEKEGAAEPSVPPASRPIGSIEAPSTVKSEAGQAPSTKSVHPKSTVEKTALDSKKRQNARRSAVYKELEDSKLFTVEELTEIKNRMKTRFENELGAFEEELHKLLEAKLGSMEDRIVAKFVDEAFLSQNRPGAGLDSPFDAAPIPSPDLDPEDTDWNLDEGPTAVAPVQESPKPPIPPVPSLSPFDVELLETEDKPETDASLVEPIPGLANSGKTRRGLWLTVRAVASVVSQKWRGLALGRRLAGINAGLARWEILGKRPFARSWVAPVTGAGLVLLLVLSMTLLGGKQNAVSPDSSTFVAPQSARLLQAVVAAGAEMSAIGGKADASAGNRLESRDDAYAMGRSLYIVGDMGIKARGERVGRQERVRALLDAIPHLENVLAKDVQNQVMDPDVWFLLARTHYLLAKLGHDRKKHAAASLEAFKKYLKLATVLPKKKRATIRRNIKILRRWLGS